MATRPRPIAEPRGPVLRVVAIGRVSSEEQVKGYSLDAQERAWEQYCEQRGWELVARLVEPGNSAYTSDWRRRPVLAQALEMLERREADVLMVHKLDRLARNVRITLETLSRVQKAAATFVSISEQMDFTTPIGRLQLVMLAAIAEYFSANLSTETRKGKAERAAQGKSNASLRPLGYHADWSVCPAQAKVVRWLFAEYATGRYAVHALVAQLNQEKTLDRRWSSSSVYKVLHNSTYLGLVADGPSGATYPGQHKPIIDQEVWDAAHHVFAANASNPRTHAETLRTYLLAGLLRCSSCGHTLRASTLINRRGDKVHEYPRYQEIGRWKGADCPQPQDTVQAHVPEGQVYRLLAGIPLDGDVIARIEELAAEPAPEEDELGRKRAALNARRKRINSLFEYGGIDDDEYRTKLEEIKQELAALPDPKAGGPGLALREAVPQLADLLDDWAYMDTGLRAAILRQMLVAVDFDSETRTVLGLRPRPELAALFRLAPELREESGRFVPDPPLAPVPRKHTKAYRRKRATEP